MIPRLIDGASLPEEAGAAEDVRQTDDGTVQK